MSHEHHTVSALLAASLVDGRGHPRPCLQHQDTLLTSPTLGREWGFCLACIVALCRPVIASQALHTKEIWLALQVFKGPLLMMNHILHIT